MTSIELFRENGNITGFVSQGHAGYAEEGSDIVCAAVSAVLQTTLLGLTDYLKVPAKSEMKAGFMALEIPAPLASDERVKTIFNTMLLGLQSICLEAPKYLIITDRRCKH